MNTSKQLFLNRIENHICNGNAYLNDLPHKEQKIITTLFLKQLSDSDRDEYTHDFFDNYWWDNTTPFVMDILQNEDEEIDPLSEMKDELILNLIDLCEDAIQEYFDREDNRRLLDQDSVRYSAGIVSPPTDQETDHMQRVRDMMSAFPIKVY